MQGFAAVLVDREQQVRGVGDRGFQAVQLTALQVHQFGGEWGAEADVAVVAGTFEVVHPEPHHDPVQLGEAEQVAGLFGSAVGGRRRAAIEQQPVLVLIQFQDRSRE